METARCYGSSGASELAMSVEKERGPVSILVNNAGHVVKQPTEQMPIRDFEGLHKTHVTGAFAL